MNIYRPIKTNRLSQTFGANNSCARVGSDGKLTKPFQVETKVGATCPLGFGDFYRAIGMLGHNGEDWASYHHEPGYFNVDIPGMRWWASVEVDDAQGINLDIHSLEPVSFTQDELPPQTSSQVKALWEAQGKKLYIKFRFTHGSRTFLEDKPKVQVGTFADGSPQLKPEVKLGDLIFYSDTTGASSGDHVHRSMKFCAKNSQTIGGDNGFLGAVDDSRWYDNTFVLDVVNYPQLPITPQPEKASKLVRALAEKRNAEGFKDATILFAVARILEAWGN